MFEVNYKNIFLGKYTSLAGMLLVALVSYLLIKGTATLTEATPLILLSLYLLGAKDPKRVRKQPHKNEHNDKSC